MKKIIFVTGASSGIGKALSIKFANSGWKVLASARRLELLKKLDVFDEPSEQVNKMIDSCIKLLKSKVKTSTFFSKVKKWFISIFIKCNCTC